MPESQENKSKGGIDNPHLKALFVVGQIDPNPKAQQKIENNIQAALQEGVGDKGLMINPRQLVEDYNLESGARLAYTGHGNVERHGKGDYGKYGQQIYVDYLGRKADDIKKDDGGEKPLICNISCHGGSAKHPEDFDGNKIEGVDTLSIGSRKYPVQGVAADNAAVIIAKNAKKSNLELVGEVAIGVGESMRVNGKKITGPKPLTQNKEGGKEQYPVLDDEFLKQHLQEKIDKVADAMGYDASDPSLDSIREKAGSEETIKSYREKLLNSAVQRRDVDKAEAIMEGNKAAGARTATDGKDALTYAIGNGNMEMTKMLLSQGAELEEYSDKSLAFVNKTAGEEMGMVVGATQFIDDNVDKALTKKHKTPEEELKKASKVAKIFSEDAAQELGYDLTERMKNRATRGVNSLREKGKGDRADRIERQSERIDEKYSEIQDKRAGKASSLNDIKTSAEAFENAINANSQEAIQFVQQETDVAAIIASQTKLDVKDVIARANLSDEKAMQFEEVVTKSQKSDKAEKQEAIKDNSGQDTPAQEERKRPPSTENIKAAPANEKAETSVAGESKSAKMNELLKSDEFKNAKASLKKTTKAETEQKPNYIQNEAGKSMDDSGHSR